MIRIRDMLRRRLWPPSAMVGEAAQALFDSLPDAAALLDAQGRVQQANATLRQALGPAQPVRPGLHPARFFDNASRGAAEAWLSGGVAPAELRLAAPEGLPGIPVAPRRIDLPQGASLLVLRDLSESRALAARVAEGDRLQALGTLAGGIAHDFNNLLAVVLGGTEDALAQLPAPADPMVQAELEQVRQAALRGAGLVRQLLAYAQRQVLAPRLVSLNDAVSAMARLLRPLLGRQVTLELVLDEPGRWVMIDPSQLDRVLMNLAMNARQAMPEGGRLRLSTGRLLLLQPRLVGSEEVPAGRWTVLEVRDSGIGIPPEALPRIFEPFFTNRAQQGGTGMGLATVRGIVRQSGGYVTVESQLGHGTRFRILLPRVEAAAPRPVSAVLCLPAATSAPAARADAAGDGVPVDGIAVRPNGAEPTPPLVVQLGTLLLVEDEPPLLRLAERALRRAGWQVTTAGDAEAALALVAGGLRPALLVSDVIMPGLDGVALAQALRQQCPGLPVLLVSGYAPGMVRQELSGAPLHFLAKPYGTEELVRAAALTMASEASCTFQQV